MFDSPFQWCPLLGSAVLLDQTQHECAAEHGCDTQHGCPLEDCFCGYDFSVPPPPAQSATQEKT